MAYPHGHWEWPNHVFSQPALSPIPSHMRAHGLPCSNKGSARGCAGGQVAPPPSSHGAFPSAWLVVAGAIWLPDVEPRVTLAYVALGGCADDTGLILGELTEYRCTEDFPHCVPIFCVSNINWQAVSAVVRRGMGKPRYCSWAYKEVPDRWRTPVKAWCSYWPAARATRIATLCTHTSHRRGRPGGLTVCLQLTISLPHPPKQHSVGLAWCCEARIRVLAPLPVHAQTHPDRSNLATCLPSSLAEQACTPSSADLSYFARTRQRRHRIHARPCIASTGRGGSPAVLPTASRLLRPPVAII
jgi:hypothetical protein